MSSIPRLEVRARSHWWDLAIEDIAFNLNFYSYRFSDKFPKDVPRGRITAIRTFAPACRAYSIVNDSYSSGRIFGVRIILDDELRRNLGKPEIAETSGAAFFINMLPRGPDLIHILTTGPATWKSTT